MKGTLREHMLPAPVAGGFRMEGYWVWCGSVVKGEDGKYHMFASCWPKEVPMHPGWLIKSQIVRAVSDTPIGPFQFEEVVLPARSPRYWDGVATHNPHIIKVNDTYVLYYMGTTHPFTDNESMQVRVIAARANKRIGIATSKSVYGPWERRNAPILDTRPEYFDSFLVSNPSPCVLQDGTVYMMYKARDYVENSKFTFGTMTLGIASAKAYNDVYTPICDRPVFTDDIQLEDPYIWYDEDGFNLMAKDMYGNVCGQEYGGIHALSKDGVQWEIKKDKLFYTRDILWDDGVVRKMGNLERPFILFEDGKPTHAYFATSDGKFGFEECDNTWNMVIPLDYMD